MRRSEFLGTLFLSVSASRRLIGQDSAAAPLRSPEAVQQRTRTVSGDNDLLVQELEKRLRCTCGCNLDVFTCRTTDFTCQTSPAMHRDVLARLESSSPDEVVAQFVAQYGESILMQPPKQGFNWAAYLTPFAALIVGIAVLTLLMRAMVRRSETDRRTDGRSDSDDAAPGEPPDGLSESDRERLRHALNTFES